MARWLNRTMCVTITTEATHTERDKDNKSNKQQTGAARHSRSDALICDPASAPGAGRGPEGGRDAAKQGAPEERDTGGRAEREQKNKAARARQEHSLHRATPPYMHTRASATTRPGRCGPSQTSARATTPRRAPPQHLIDVGNHDNNHTEKLQAIGWPSLACPHARIAPQGPILATIGTALQPGSV